MVSAVVRGSPVDVLDVLMHGSANTTILGPARKVSRRLLSSLVFHFSVAATTALGCRCCVCVVVVVLLLVQELEQAAGAGDWRVELTST